MGVLVAFACQVAWTKYSPSDGALQFELPSEWRCFDTDYKGFKALGKFTPRADEVQQYVQALRQAFDRENKPGWINHAVAIEATEDAVTFKKFNCLIVGSLPLKYEFDFEKHGISIKPPAGSNASIRQLRFPLSRDDRTEMFIALIPGKDRRFMFAFAYSDLRETKISPYDTVREFVMRVKILKG